MPAQLYSVLAPGSLLFHYNRYHIGVNNAGWVNGVETIAYLFYE